MQWGVYDAPDAFVTINFPIAFSSTEYIAVTGLGSTTDYDGASTSTPSIRLSKKTKSSLDIGLRGGSVYWKYHIIVLGK